jgi:type I restriction enzyme, S subunit
MSKNKSTEWKKVLLRDLCSKIQYGYTEKANTVPVGPKFLRITDIVPDTINWEEVPYCVIPEKKYKQYSLKQGDIVIARTGATTGYAKYLKNVPPSVFASYLVRLQIVGGVDRRYIGFIVESNGYKDFIKQNIGGSAQPNANAQILTSYLLDLPNYDTQRKIAAILSAYDNLIENNLRRIKILEEMAQLIYREWFVHFRFPGHEKVKIVDSPLGKIPYGWEITPLSEIVNTQYGYTESAEDKPVGPKYLRGTDINKTTYINWSFVPYCKISDDQVKKYKLNIGDIVLIRMADPGKVGIVENDINAVFASYLVRFVIKSNIVKPYYLFFFLNDDRYQGYIKGASTGTTRKSASAGVLTGIDIVVPPKPIIDEFEDSILTLRQLLNNLLIKNNILRHTRDLLIPKLISGELDVSDLDITLPEVVEA